MALKSTDERKYFSMKENRDKDRDHFIHWKQLK